jgi:hypothetical protein
VADNPAQADKLWKRCRGRLVLEGGNDAGLRSEIDFDTQRLVYIHMGARSTGGFHLDLADEGADLVDRTLIIPVTWEMPSKDAVVPQMLTHPCLLLAAPRGGYERIQILDQAGDVRLAANFPAGKLPAAVH